MKYVLMLVLLVSAALYTDAGAQTKDYTPQTCPVVGNADSLIYHIPGDRFYDQLLKVNKQTDNRKCFKSQKEAREAGYRRSDK